MSSTKADIISFKVDQELMQLLKRIDNRSEFIRSAVLAALDNTCPLCSGSGIVQPHLRSHWKQLADSHPQAECKNCHERVFTCDGKTLKHACKK
jgi:hypothetical protein